MQSSPQHFKSWENCPFVALTTEETGQGPWTFGARALLGIVWAGELSKSMLNFLCYVSFPNSMTPDQLHIRLTCYFPVGCCNRKFYNRLALLALLNCIIHFNGFHNLQYHAPGSLCFSLYRINAKIWETALTLQFWKIKWNYWHYEIPLSTRNLKIKINIQWVVFYILWDVGKVIDDPWLEKSSNWSIGFWVYILWDDDVAGMYNLSDVGGIPVFLWTSGDIYILSEVGGKTSAGWEADAIFECKWISVLRAGEPIWSFPGDAQGMYIFSEVGNNVVLVLWNVWLTVSFKREVENMYVLSEVWFKVASAWWEAWAIPSFLCDNWPILSVLQDIGTYALSQGNDIAVSVLWDVRAVLSFLWDVHGI